MKILDELESSFFLILNHFFWLHFKNRRSTFLRVRVSVCICRCVLLRLWVEMMHSTRGNLMLLSLPTASLPCFPTFLHQRQLFLMRKKITQRENVNANWENMKMRSWFLIYQTNATREECTTHFRVSWWCWCGGLMIAWWRGKRMKTQIQFLWKMWI